jgi:hypothetical protein
MKRIILILTVGIFPYFGFSQPFITIPVDSTSVWRVFTYDYDGSITFNSDIKYYIDGDTIINQMSYSKLYSSGIRKLNGNPNPYSALLHGGLRNSNKQVFYYSVTDNQETLLFDFSLNVGDTLPVTFINDNGFIITSIDSVLVGDQYRKRFNLTNPTWIDFYSTWIVEGVGHEFGLIETMFEYPGKGSRLLCYAEDYIPVFPEGVICDLNLGSDENLLPQQVLQIYPNPAMDRLIVKTAWSGNSIIQIINLDGKILLETQLDKALTGISTENLTPGIYLIRIIGSKGVATNKFIKK